MSFGGPGEGPWGDDVANAPLEPHMGMRTLGAALGVSFLSTLAQAEGSRGARRGLHMMQGVLVTLCVSHTVLRATLRVTLLFHHLEHFQMMFILQKCFKTGTFFFRINICNT